MSKSLINLVVVVFQLKEAATHLIVKPQDVIAAPGQRASFNCSVNTSEGIRWMYATEKGSEMQDHIYSDGFTYPQWKKRHNVTERGTGFFTLTIDPVGPNDTGYYSCMDIQDDEHHETKLTVAAGTSQATYESTTSFYLSVTYLESSILENFTSISEDFAVTDTNESINILTYVIGSSCAAGFSLLLLFLVMYFGRRKRNLSKRHSVCGKSESKRQRSRETASEEDGENVHYQHVLPITAGQRTSAEISSTQYAQLSLDKDLYENPDIRTQNATNLYEELPEPDTNPYAEIAF